MRPDALLFEPRGLVGLLVEIKFRHGLEAYWQLAAYLDALRALMPSWRFVPLIVCRWFSAHDPVPVAHRLEPEPQRLLYEPERARGLVSVHICSAPRSSFGSDRSIR